METANRGLKRKREEEKMSLGTNDSLLGKYALNVELQASGIKVPPFKKSKNQISEHATFVFTLIPDYTSSDPAPITISFSDPAPASLLPPAPTSLSIPHSEPPLAPAGATATATAAFPSAAKNSARDSLASIGSLSDSFGKLLSSTLLSSAPANVSCTSLSIIEPPSISLNDWSMATWYDTKNVSRRPRRNKHSSKSKSLAANSNSLSDSSVMCLKRKREEEKMSLGTNDSLLGKYALNVELQASGIKVPPFKKSKNQISEHATFVFTQIPDYTSSDPAPITISFSDPAPASLLPPAPTSLSIPHSEPPLAPAGATATASATATAAFPSAAKNSARDSLASIGSLSDSFGKLLSSTLLSSAPANVSCTSLSIIEPPSISLNDWSMATWYDTKNVSRRPRRNKHSSKSKSLAANSNSLSDSSVMCLKRKREEEKMSLGTNDSLLGKYALNVELQASGIKVPPFKKSKNQISEHATFVFTLIPDYTSSDPAPITISFSDPAPASLLPPAPTSLSIPHSEPPLAPAGATATATAAFPSAAKNSARDSLASIGSLSDSFGKLLSSTLLSSAPANVSCTSLSIIEPPSISLNDWSMATWYDTKNVSRRPRRNKHSSKSKSLAANSNSLSDSSVMCLKRKREEEKMSLGTNDSLLGKYALNVELQASGIKVPPFKKSKNQISEHATFVFTLIPDYTSSDPAPITISFSDPAPASLLPPAPTSLSIPHSEPPLAPAGATATASATATAAFPSAAKNSARDSLASIGSLSDSFGKLLSSTLLSSAPANVSCTSLSIIEPPSISLNDWSMATWYDTKNVSRRPRRNKHSSKSKSLAANSNSLSDSSVMCLKRKREEEKMSLGTNDSLLGKYALNVELQASGIKVPPLKKSKNQISEHATFVFTLIPDYTSSDPAPITISFSDPAPASLLPPAPTSLSIPHSEPPLAPAGATATATAAFPSAAKNSARDSLASIGSLSDSFGKLLSSTLLSSAPANVSCTSLSIIEPPSISLNDWSMATWYDTKNVSRRPRRNKHSSKSKSLAANSNSLSDSSVMCLKRKREEEKMSLGTNDSLLGKSALNVELQASGIKVPPFKKSKNQISEHATFVFTQIPDYTSSDPAPITISFSDPAPASLLPPAPTSLSIPHSEPPLAPAGATATATATAAFPSAAKNSARDSLASIGSLSDSFGKLLSSTLLSSAPANVSCTSLSIIEPPSISLNDWSMATWYDTKNVSRRPRRNKHSSKSKSLAANSNSLSDSSVMCLKRKREEEKMSLGTNDSLLGKYALNVELQASGIKVPPFKKSKNQISEHATFVFTQIPDYTSSDPAPITISFSDPAPASLLPPAPTSLSIPHSEPPLAPAGATATATATAAFPSAAKNSARDSLASIGSLSDSFGKLLSSTLLSSAPANVSCTSLSIIEPPSISLNDWSMATWYDTKNVSRRPRRNKHSSKSKSLAANSNSLSDSSVMYGSCSVKMPSHMSHNLTVTHTYENRARQALSLLKKKFPQPLQEMSPVMQEGRTETYEQRAREALVKLKMSRERQQHNEA